MSKGGRNAHGVAWRQAIDNWILDNGRAVVPYYTHRAGLFMTRKRMYDPVAKNEVR
jgi:hypothetical protein